MSLKAFDKFRTICIRYNVYFTRVTDLECFLLKHVMLKAYEQHKDINFESFVRNVVNSPIDYLYDISSTLDDVIDLNLMNNCFKDKANHYGCKYKGKWFFLTHSANMFSKRLAPNHYNIKNKPSDSATYLVAYDNIQPNVVELKIGTIKKTVVEDYITKFL